MLCWKHWHSLTWKIEQTNLDVIQQHTWISRRTVSGCGPEEKYYCIASFAARFHQSGALLVHTCLAPDEKEKCLKWVYYNSSWLFVFWHAWGWHGLKIQGAHTHPVSLASGFCWQQTGKLDICGVTMSFLPRAWSPSQLSQDPRFRRFGRRSMLLLHSSKMVRSWLGAIATMVVIVASCRVNWRKCRTFRQDSLVFDKFKTQNS